MNTPAQPSSDESQIRQLLDEWRAALAARDLDRLTAAYSPDVVFYDAVPPIERRGIAAYRASWENMLPFLPPRIASEVRDISLTVSGDLALMHGLQRIINADTGEAATCGWVRVTVAYQRQHSQWRVTHEHVSVPFDPQTAKAVFAQEL